jgi:hypothetical protein
LSSYAGPIPLPVVPILFLPFCTSLIWSISLWKLNIKHAFSEIKRFFFVIFIPDFFNFSISSIKALGLTTTPLPIIETLLSLIIPDGSRLNAIFFLFTTILWPALFQP